MLKEGIPIGTYTDGKGKKRTYIRECFAQFMQQVAIGTPPEEMGLFSKKRDILNLIKLLKEHGVDFPTAFSPEWGATPMERAVSCALGNGEVSRKAAAEALKITFEDLRTHMTNMRKKGYPLPKIPRGKYAPSKIKK